MQCLECALSGIERHAAGLCPVCSVGLCVSHLRENELRTGPGGMSGYSCTHQHALAHAGAGQTTSEEGANTP